MKTGRLASRLTKREEQIICLAKGGCDDLLIAQVLGVNPETLHRLWAGLWTRLGVINREQAIAVFDHSFAFDRGADSASLKSPGSFAVIDHEPVSRSTDRPVPELVPSSNSFFLDSIPFDTKFRLFVQGLADAYVSVDMTGRIQEFNDVFPSIVGYTDEEIHELSYRDLTPAKWHDYEDRIIQEQVLTKGYSNVYEKEYIHKNGTVFPVELRTFLFNDGSGTPIGMWAMVRDISARKGAEHALFESELKYRALFESANDAILLIRNDRYVDCNARALEMFGCTRIEFLRMSLFDLSPEKQPDGQLSSTRGRLLVESLLREGRCSFEWVCRKVSGELFDVDIALNVINLDNDALIQMVIRDVTQPKKAIENLKLSESKFRQTFNLLPVGACVVSLDYVIQNCNKAYCDFVGYSESELIGRTFRDITHPDDLDVGVEATHAIAEGRLDTCRFEKRYIRKDGEVVWGELTFTSIKDPNRKSLYFIPIVIDITAKRLAEESLRESEAKLQAVFDNSLDAISVSKNGIHTFVNPAYLTLFGFDDPGELVSTPLMTIIAPESKAMVDEYAKRRYQGLSVPSTYDAMAQRKDGSTFLMEVNAASFELKKERYTLAILRDITERRRAQEALKKSEEKFAKAFHATPEPASISTMSDGTYVDVNDVFLKAIGYRREEVIGQRSIDLDLTVDPKDRERYVEKLLNDKHVRDFESTFRTRSGEVRDIIVSGELIEIDGTVYNLSFYTDVTERRLAEKRVHEAQLELERRVEERTIQLEMANHELEAFSYSVSHDLRAPLRALDGFSRILMEDYKDGLDEDGRLYLTRIGDAADKMGRLVDDLLKLARINRAALVRKEVNLSSLAKGIINNLSEADCDRVVRVQIANKVMAWGDPDLLGSVMDNLLSNAWKYTSKKLHSNIEIGATWQDGRTVYFVRDDGAGFDMSHASHLFGAFQRLHSEAEFPGDGIGLATVQRIVHRHGGRVWAESEVGKGATFYFTLGFGDISSSPKPTSMY